MQNIWVRPPGKRPAKLVSNSWKGIFRGYVPYTTQNILWYDPKTHQVKIATHARFDEGHNNIPTNQIPPNTIQLQRTEDRVVSNDNQRIAADQEDIDTKSLHFYITPFAHFVHFTTWKLLRARSDPRCLKKREKIKNWITPNSILAHLSLCIQMWSRFCFLIDNRNFKYIYILYV